MSSKLRHIAVFSGTTILGDGSVIMIVDPNGVAQALGRAAQAAQADTPELKQGEAAAADDIVSLLVFRAGSQQLKAVPLSLVTRLEEIDCRRIEISDGRHLVQYRDQLMPLVAHRRRGRPEKRRRPADPGVLRSRPLDGSCGRRDRRHRRGQARHRSRQQPSRRARLRRGQGQHHRDRRRRAISCRRPSRTGSAAARAAKPGRRARFCWSTTRRSSATCWRR